VSSPSSPFPHVTLHLWRVPAGRLPRVLWRMARDRSGLRALPGVRFAKLVGTGRGRAFGAGSADLTRWAAIVAWSDREAADGFDAGEVARAWRRLAVSSCRIDCRPERSRGRWAGVEPFGTPAPDPLTRSGHGPVLALTRARLRPARAATFWRAIRPITPAVRGAPGLLSAFGFGEAPVGWQGTVSVWANPTDLVEFAYRHPQHVGAILGTARHRWYAEELFARFVVLDVVGDRSVIDWSEEESGHHENRAVDATRPRPAAR
jgi:hypothetical protein